MADPKITVSYLKVALAIGFHLNRKEGGWAWPGIQRIATIAHVHPRTVMRATAWLCRTGHLEVVKQRKGARNFANRYRPVLKRAIASRSDVTAMSLGSGKATSLGSGVAMSPEPLTEPLSEHNIPIKISAPPIGGADESGIRQSKESETVERPIAPSAASECYRLAGAYDGDRGRKLVTKALDEGADPQEVLDEIGAAVEVGDDLGAPYMGMKRGWATAESVRARHGGKPDRTDEIAIIQIPPAEGGNGADHGRTLGCTGG